VTVNEFCPSVCIPVYRNSGNLFMIRNVLPTPVWNLQVRAGRQVEARTVCSCDGTTLVAVPKLFEFQQAFALFATCDRLV
jgi:hypothetical protein